MARRPTMTQSAFAEMAERSAAGGFSLLMWKNTLLQRRHPVQSLIEIGAPVVFSVLLVVVRSLVDPLPFTKPIDYVAFNPNRMVLGTANNGSNIFNRSVFFVM